MKTQIKKKIKITPFYTHSSAMIFNFSQKVTLNDLDEKNILEHLSKHGCLILRNIKICDLAFLQFTQTVFNHTTINLAFSTHTPIQRCDNNSAAKQLHCSNAHLPYHPDLQVYYCQTSTPQYPKLTISDGIQAWREINATTKKQVIDNKIIYHNKHPLPVWQKYLSFELQQQYQYLSLEHIKSIKYPEGITFKVVKNASIQISFRTSLLQQSKFSQDISFCNGLFAAPGSQCQIHADTLRDIKKTIHENSYDIKLQDGDVVIIDNSRILHSRKLDHNGGTVLYSSLGYIPIAK